jgi:ParB-like chromosome segregation protein Spo0J
MELVDSVSEHGVLSPILVRPVGSCYEVVDGFNRYLAALEANLTDVPVVIKDLSDDEVLVLQVIANATVIPTDAIDYSYRLRLLMSRSPGMTQSKLAKTLNKSIAWVSKMLGLEKLIDEAALRLRRGEMPLTSALELATLPKFLQVEYLDTACNLPTNEFVLLASQQRKAFKEAVQAGSFKPTEDKVAYLRPLHVVRREMEAMQEAAHNLLDAKTPMDGWKEALRWVLNLSR